MANGEVKVIGAALVLLILVGRYFLSLRGLQGDARAREMRKSVSGGLLPIAAVAGLFFYYLFLFVRA